MSEPFAVIPTWDSVGARDQGYRRLLVGSRSDQLGNRTRQARNPLSWHPTGRSSLAGQNAPALLIDRDRRSLSVQRSKEILQDRPTLLGKSKQSAYQVEKSGLFADIQELEQFRAGISSQGGEKPFRLVDGIALAYGLKIVDYSRHGGPGASRRSMAVTNKTRLRVQS
jgi:hypothetical protein